MIKSFKHSTTTDPVELRRANESMLDILQALATRKIPSATYTMNDLERYLLSLIKGQEKTPECTTFGSWSAAPKSDGMPADARVEFIYIPTYIATSTLSIALLEHPITTLLIPGYLIALINGLVFCTGRELRGHGCDVDIGAIDAINILSLGKIPLLLDQNPNYCPRLKKILHQATRDMAEKLNTGDYFSDLESDYAIKLKSTLESFRLGGLSLSN
ncbi:hypothetical protein KRX52_03470 [Pseudomonas sp. MAP12]|uniref:Uncharacterized protein n=2 Tax=Geopseudomonas aromaticivorans TaxID=2849492 RepID=A0ABS6MTX7_9GAMM|nr:hypothetical protein [Pseudomonas aromaticivorans]